MAREEPSGLGARRWLAVAVVALCALWIAPPIGATSNTVIGFDDLSPGATVTNQYASQGVTFGNAATFNDPGSTGDCGGPTVANAQPPASAPNYAQLVECATPGSFGSGTYGGFDYPRGSLSVKVRSLDAAAGSLTVDVTGYDSSGTVVASGQGTATTTGWTSITANQLTGGPVPAHISSFSITGPAGNAAAIGIDDLSFDHAGAPLSATGDAISASAGSPFSGQVATISDGDPTAVASDFSATIDWGDGSPASTGTVSGGSGQFAVSGSHTWAAPGNYGVTVNVTKVNGRTASAGATASVSAGGGGGGGGGVSPVAQLALVTPQPVVGGLVTFTGAGSQACSGKIISFDWDFNNDGKIDTSTGTNPIARFAFTPGPHTIGLTVTNSNGAKSKTSLTFAPQIQPQPPADGGTGDCKTTYDTGNVHLLAECIQTDPNGGYVIATRDLTLDGMTLAPTAGGFGVFHIFTHLGNTELSGPAVNVELLNTPIGDLVLGGRDLSSQPLTLAYFHPPKFKLADDDSAGKSLLMSLGVGHECKSGDKSVGCCPKSGPTSACATLPGNFPITGQFSVYLNNKGQALFDVQVGLDLSDVGFQATGALEIVADLQSGINLGSLKFTIPQAGLASIFQVKDASFAYYFPDDPDKSKQDTWQAKATIIFGPLSQPSLQGELDFEKGNFKFASLLFTAPTGTGVPIYPGILLNQLGASVGVNPLAFGGQLGASIATQLELSLGFKYSEPTDTQLGFFGGQGKLSLGDDDIATLSADVFSDGYTDAKLNIDLHFPFDSSDPIVKVGGDIGFWDEPTSGRWEADGDINLKLWVISAEVAGLVNDQYVAGCANISGFGVQGRYRFADGNVDGGFFGFSNCKDQLKQYKETPVTPHPGGFNSRVGAHESADGGTVTLPGGQMGEELRVSSPSGTPVVTITSPDGKTSFTTPSDPTKVTASAGSYISAIAPDGHSVIVLLRHPEAGKWSVDPAPGAPSISTVETAADVPPATITARVRHLRGRTYSLNYKIANYLAGTQVQFVQRGKDSTNVIGTVRNARGSFKFAPQDAIGRQRTILAYLRTATGAPLRTITVGKFTAPGALRGGPVKRLRVTRRGGNALVSFARARNAREYRVSVHGSDSRILTLFAKAGARSVTVPQVLPSQSLTVTAVALGGPNMLPGKPAHARLAAVPCRVPRLKGKSQSAAAIALSKGSCGVGKVKGRGKRVASQSPRAGTRRRYGSPVNVTLSRS